MSPVPVFLSYSTPSTSPPSLLGREKLISSRSFILSSGMEGGMLETLSSFLETSRWTYIDDSTHRKGELAQVLAVVY